MKEKLPKIYVLNSGIRVLTLPLDNLPLATILILVKTGTDYENKKINGISHFIEHLFFKGTKTYPNPNELALELDKIGAEYNAFTSYEYSAYYIKTLPQFLERAIELLSDMLLNPLFDEKELEKERKVILEEMKYIHDTPHYHVFDLALETAYGDQPAGWPIIGRKNILLKLKREDIFDYFVKQYRAKNIIIVVVGDIKTQEILKKLETSFKNINKGKAEYRKASTKKIFKPRIKFATRSSLKQAHLALLFKTEGRKDLGQRKHRIKLLTSLLGYGTSSRFYKILRQELGLTYYLRVDHDLYEDRGYLYVQLGCKPENLKLALEKIKEVLIKLKKEKIADEEIDKARAIFKNSILNNFETSYDLAIFYGFKYFFEKKLGTIKEVIEAIDRLKAKDLIEESKKIFTFKNFILAIFSPYVDRKINLALFNKL